MGQVDPHGLLAHPFASGPICWILVAPIVFKRPPLITGQQGLWTLPANLLSSATR